MRIQKIYPIILILALIPGFIPKALSGELINPRLDASYEKLSDGTKRISLTLSASVDDKRVKIENAQLQINAVNESEKTILGTAVTDGSGKAFLDVKPGKSLPVDKEGYYTFEIRYAGNQKFSMASQTVHVKDVFMDISSSKKDSIYNVQLKVYRVDEKGMKSPVQDIPVEFYIKRLFCLYRFGGGNTDSSGLYTSEFPKNMPGDTSGNVIVIGKIIENDTYGTVDASLNFAHGKPLIIEPKSRRGLGDTDAPLWMVYTLLVLLSGVWIHVLYVLGLVIRINIMGKRALGQTKTG